MAEHLTLSSGEQRLLAVHDSSDVAEVRRVATRIVSGIGFDNIETANVALVATELTTNLIKHAKGGQLVVGLLQHGTRVGVELMALDHGPGIRDLAQSMRDGYSTAGSSGTGLGAVKRLSCVFDIHSLPGKGTAVLARLWSGGSKSEASGGIEYGVVCLPMPGYEIPGDGWTVQAVGGKYACTVIDGLGHGPDAAVAAKAALAIAHEYRDKAPADLVERAHGALRSTRGAALAVGEIHPASRLVRFCGVGNIAATIISEARIRHLVSYSGIVGQEARKIAEFSYPWSPDSLLIMHSDGLSTHWNLNDYPALMQRHPALIAGVLYRDFSRGRDDITVLAARENSAH